jgi:Protein of unknown function (DUF3467)
MNNGHRPQKKDKTMSTGDPKEEEVRAPAGTEDKNAIRVTWDDAQMQTSFANVINVLNTREEFTMLFGTNQSWNVAGSGEVRVLLSNRVVLTPHAAKRLLTLLAARVEDYEKRFGKMTLDSITGVTDRSSSH